MENSHLKVININETGLAKCHQALSSWVGSGHKTILLRNVICVQTSALLRNAIEISCLHKLCKLL